MFTLMGSVRVSQCSLMDALLFLYNSCLQLQYFLSITNLQDMLTICFLKLKF